MVKLTDQQKQSVAEWAAEGVTLSEIQDRLKQTYEIVLTYFDTRLLIMESGVQLRDRKKEEAEKEAAEAAKKAELEALAAAAMPPDDGDDTLPPDAGFDDAFSADNVAVSLDEIAIPGTMVSGKVAFSDGVTVGWQLDQTGRLSLRDSPPGYQPSAPDITAFQQKLQQLLR